MWDPALCPSVIPIVAIAGWRGDPESSFRIRALGCRASVFVARNGTEHILVGTGQGRVQLAVTGESVLRPARLLTDVAMPAGGTACRLAAIAAFNAGCADQTVSSSVDQHCSFRRLCLVLRALDGHLAGLRQREIAEGLFGGARVQKEWRDPGSYLRDRVRRAIRRGHALMVSEYRHLLA
jgi:hypothetical protein